MSNDPGKDAVRAIRERAMQRAARGEPASVVSTPGMRMVSRPSPMEDLRGRVLDAATALLLRTGFSKVGLEDVALEAGVARSKLLEICFSREELFFQVLTREVERVVADLQGLLQPDVPVMELMRAVSERSQAFMADHPLLLQLMLGEAADAMPDWADRLNELRQRLLRFSQQVVQVGIDQEILRQDVPAELVAGLLFEVHVAGFLLHGREGPEAKVRATQRRAAILDVLYNGLRRR